MVTMTPLDLDQAEAAMAASRLRAEPKTLVEVWAHNDFAGTLGLFETVQVKWSARGQATITMQGRDPLAGIIRSCRKALVRVRIHQGDVHWDGRVWISRDSGVGADWRVTAECVGVEKILDGILAYPEPLVGEELLQVIRKSVYTGPVATGQIGRAHV